MISAALEMTRKATGQALRYKVHGIALSACAALGVLTALLADIGSVNTLADGDNWDLPSSNNESTQESVARIVSQPLWGGEPPVSEAEADEGTDEDEFPEDAWRLIGIVSEGPDRWAIVETLSTKELTDLKAGDMLPDGGTITEIDNGSVFFTRRNNEDVVRLFAERTAAEE